MAFMLIAAGVFEKQIPERAEALQEVRSFVSAIRDDPHLSSREISFSVFNTVEGDDPDFPRLGNLGIDLIAMYECDDSLSILSDDFVSKEAVLEFGREAGLADLLDFNLWVHSV